MKNHLIFISFNSGRIVINNEKQYHSYRLHGIVFSCHLPKNDTSYYDSCENSGLFKMKFLIRKPCTCNLSNWQLYRKRQLLCDVHSFKNVMGIVQWNTNYLLFIQVYFIAFEVGPSRNNVLMPTNNPIIKTFLEGIFRNKLQFSPRILFYVLYRLKTGASCSNLSFWKRKKSAGAISGEYGGCSMIYVEFFARNSFTMIAL